MDELPKTYKPSELRPEEPPEEPREVRYAVGYTEDHISIGMAHGPFAELEKALEVVPAFKPREDGQSPETAVIFRFNADHTDDELYVWDREEELWVLNQDSG